MAANNRTFNALILIVAFGFILRIWGIGFGPYHPDEPLVVNQALAFGTGKLLPTVYYYPPLLHYILFLCYGLFYLIGWLLGPFRTFDNFLKLVLIDQLPFYIIGRFISALAGTLTIIPVYIITKKLYSKNAAILASLFISCMYLHVRNSHYCTVDVMMTLMLSLSYIFILKIAEKNLLKDYLWAGVLTGLAISTKYNSGVLIFLIAAAGLTHISFKKNAINLYVVKNLILSYLCALIVFLLLCSFVILDLKGFLNAFEVLYQIGKDTNVSIWYRFRVDLLFGIGILLELFGLCGFAYLIVKKEKKGIIFVLFPAIYLFCIRKIGGQVFARYSIPLLPFFAISTSIFLTKIFSILKIKSLYKKVLFVSLVAISIYNPCLKSIYADYLLSKPDIRDLARDWIYANIPTGSSIVVTNSQYAPLLYPTKAQLKEKFILINNDDRGADLKRKRLEFLLNFEIYPINYYRLYYFGSSPAEFIMHTPILAYVKDNIFKNKIEYIITDEISEQNNGDFFLNLKNNLLLVKAFSPFKGGFRKYSPIPYSYMPLDDSLFYLSNNGIGIKIYKVKE